MSVRGLWRLWALLMIVAILVGLTLSSQPSGDVPTLVAARQPVRMPKLAPLPTPVDPTPILAQLSQSTLWGPLAPRPASGAASDAPPPPKWDVSGYYELGGKRFVVLSFEKQVLPSRQLTVKDKLPDGSRITRIEPDRVRTTAPSADAAAPQAEGASQPTSRWLPITPGLPAAQGAKK